MQTSVAGDIAGSVVDSAAKLSAVGVLGKSLVKFWRYSSYLRRSRSAVRIRLLSQWTQAFFASLRLE